MFGLTWRRPSARGFALTWMLLTLAASALACVTLSLTATSFGLQADTSWSRCGVPATHLASDSYPEFVYPAGPRSIPTSGVVVDDYSTGICLHQSRTRFAEGVGAGLIGVGVGSEWLRRGTGRRRRDTEPSARTRVTVPV